MVQCPSDPLLLVITGNTNDARNQASILKGLTEVKGTVVRQEEYQSLIAQWLRR